MSRLMYSMVILTALTMLATQTFAYGYGYSIIKLSQNSVTVSPGAFAKINYTVSLYNGSAGPTNLNIQNQLALGFDGVNGTLSTSTGVPPFSGVLSIHPSPSLTPGSVYMLQLNTSNYDLSYGNTILAITIGPSIGASNSTTTTPVGGVTTTAGTSVSTVPTTTVSGTGGQSSGSASGASGSSTTTYAIVAVVVVIILVVIAYMLMMKGKK